MIVKKLILASLISLTTLPALGWNLERDDTGTEYNDRESIYKYKSSTGTRYQYDLNDAGDKIDYQLDPDAQMRDRLSVDPAREIDRGLGQYGGGIEF